ncbi:MAG: N-formylglutamate amidohydrolase [Acidobacteria bacterium]|nr:N-formylglutamate amidohydrolase [Acidobacteriota bacterium]
MAALEESRLGWPRKEFVVSCEHASAHVPRAYRGLGLSASDIESHAGWDKGARELARKISRLLDCPRFEGKHSRLLIDLNRSLHHAKVIPSDSFGLPVPGNQALGNQALSAEERRRRIERYYLPYRREVEAGLSKVIQTRGRVIHRSVHTFTGRLNGVTRDADVGLLYDPARLAEKEFAKLWAERLRGAGFRVRFNYPYSGRADGFTTSCRKKFDAGAYLGIELEVNQDLLGGPDGPGKAHRSRRIFAAIAGTLPFN